MTRLSLTVTGMSCVGCEQRIAAMLARLDGIGRVEADHQAGTVVVDYDPTALDAAGITQRLTEAGYAPATGA